MLPYDFTHSIANKLRKWNEKELYYPPIKTESKKKLMEFFKEPNERLSELTGMDLSIWNG